MLEESNAVRTRQENPDSFMKIKVTYFLIVFVWLAIGSVVQAATITWANTNGGDWNIATNWDSGASARAR